MPQQPSGIGEFQIGISPIGDQPFDWSQTILSQYANSPIILQWIAYYSQYIDPTQNIDAFYDQLWNIETAVGYGLDVWGRIVGVARTIPGATQKYFGFQEAGTTSADPFNQSPFYSGEALTGNSTLSDNAFRTLIMAKAAANIWDGSIPGLNLILRTLFPGLVCYVTDGMDKTMTYRFHFTLTALQIAILQNTNVLPRPAGVLATIVQG
ncbi:DUF2612 domain-containing protein [Paraburkholderia sp. RL18-085-BIA-A]|uniref:DUF2612 domain-containing protein n=1 Tax=Paraburkholderia sp. RL18-085-BIA-A TaxID=3031633 RepID=UPI0038BCF662